MESLLNTWVVSVALGVVLGVGVLFALWRGASVIGAWLKSLREKLLTRTSFFWATNIIFMAVSVLHAGVFFGIGSDNAVGAAQYLGFAVSFFLDLTTIILMQAMLEARHRGEDDRARRFLLFIVVCCATSTFANLAIDLNDFDPTKALPHAPAWVQFISPYILASFPLFVIMISLAAEMIINIRPMDKVDEKTFEEDEKKRVKLLQLRNKYLSERVAAELEMLVIRAKQRANEALRRGKVPGCFRWPWEKPLEIDLVVAGVAKQLESVYEAKFAELSEQNGQLIQQIEQLSLAVNTVGFHGAKVAKPVPIKSSYAAGSSAGKTAELGADKAPVVGGLNGVNASLSNGGTVEGSQAGKEDSGAGGDTDGNLSSINSIPSTLDVASLDLAPDVLEVVRRYPGVYRYWLSRDVKSVSIQEIVEVTKQSKRRVQYQIGKALKKTTRNDNKILVSSVIEWLKTAPIPEQVAVYSFPQNGGDTAGSLLQDGETSLPQNGETVSTIYSTLLEHPGDAGIDKLAVTLSAMREKPDMSDEELAEILGLKREASARFWRLKAQEVLARDLELVEQAVECVNM
jgi:hypothetical protein